MNYLKLLLLCFLLPMCARAEDIYQIRRLSEDETMKTYTSLMVDACRHADQFWTNSLFDPAAGHWGTGRSDLMNEGIRAIAQMVFVNAALLKYSDVLSDAERREYLRKARAAIRFAAATHVTGTQKCPDGKPWGASWQSAMWTGTLAFGAWFIWDDLDSELRQGVERILASESDRFVGGKPTGSRFHDTKAEENGWNLICISIAANMFPHHPHATAWNEKAIEYMMNTLSTPQDLQDKRLVDGRPVKEWVSAENLHPDFTLENHGFFHPSYVACSSYFLTQTAMHYIYAGRAIPQAANHHLVDTWRMFQTMVLPWAECAYPQGMDWELHGLQYINLFASMGTYRKDPLAARMEKTCLQYMRAWQVMGNGDLAVPGSRLGFTRHSICAEQACYGFLAHKLFGLPAKELSARKAASQLVGVRNYEFTDFITHRTENKFFSFSWKHKIMGMVMPIGEGNEDNPHFTVPINNGFIGSIELNPVGDTKVKVADHSWRETSDGVETTGTLLTNGERLKQTLKVISLGDKTVVYQDRVVALTNVSVSRELGIPLGIENDKITGGTRAVYHKDGQIVFDWQKVRRPAALPGTWVNVDGRLGVVTAAGAGMTYNQSTGYLPGISVGADILYGSFSDQPKNFKAGEQLARRVAVFFAEVTPKKTAALAQSFRIEDTPKGQMLRFKLPAGGEGRVPLL